MVHDLNQKKSTQDYFFCVENQKNPILGAFLGIIPKMRFFLKNPASSVFYP